MIALPRHLASWAAQLALFPEDIALSIGPMVSRIAALVGGWRHDYAPHGTPDGHAGIDTRGLYDRLLATEWALLEELPDEFLRRAVSGEHLFLQRAYQDLAAARQSIVLFDAGPDQLGAPRLAHLAILIALAQRAAAHDASLQWGTFQDRDNHLADGVTKSNVRNLLRARCTQPVAADDIGAWMACDQLRSASEIWFIGGERITCAAREHQASALSVSEVLEPGAPSRIRVTVASPTQAGVREAILDVPPGPAAARTLRDPFDTHVAGRQTTSHAIAPNSNILFSSDGRKLYVRGVNGGIIAFQIPNSPRAEVGRPWTFAAPAGHTILAVGQSRSKRRAVVLSQQENELTVHLLSKRGRLANQVWCCTAVNHQLPPPTDGMTLRPLGFFDPGLCFIDHSGNLVELDDRKILAQGRSGVRRIAGRPRCVRLRPERPVGPTGDDGSREPLWRDRDIAAAGATQAHGRRALLFRRIWSCQIDRLWRRRIAMSRIPRHGADGNPGPAHPHCHRNDRARAGETSNRSSSRSTPVEPASMRSGGPGRRRC